MAARLHATPLYLTVPGLGNSGPGHWQTLWEASRDDFTRIELGSWSFPHRNLWVSRIEQTLAAIDRPVIFVAHSLGCHAVAHWAGLTKSTVRRANVLGALLVAPPEVDYRSVAPALRTFAPSPEAPFSFPSTVVASRNDPYMHPRRARALAERWQARFVDVGKQGHINADSGLGEWHEGQRLLAELTGGSASASRPRWDDQASNGIEL